MTTTVRKDVFSKAIGTTVKAVGANPIIPLLSNILFESNNGNSRVAGTNLEIGISYTFPSTGEPFKTCVPAKTIAALIEALHTDEIDLEIDPDNQSLIVMTESSTSNIHCAPADEFPDILQVDNPSFSLPVEQFKQSVQRVAFCSSANADSAISGVQLSVEDGKLIMFAVDGYHLSYEESTLLEEGDTSLFPIVVKGTTLEMISRTLPDEGELQVQAGKNKAMFHCEEVDVITQLMQGEFPDHNKLKESIAAPTTILTVSTLQLLRAARQLRVFASETGGSKLSAKGMLVRCSAIARDRGDADVTFAAIKKGSDIELGINIHLLYELLEICTTEYVTVETADNRSPILFRMQGVETFYHVIMPIVL